MNAWEKRANLIVLGQVTRTGRGTRHSKLLQIDMGQLFYIFNIDKRQKREGSKLGEWFPSGGATVITDLLLRNGIVEFPEDPCEEMEWQPALKADPSKTGICDLALELKHAIFHEIDDLGDALSLCLTSSHFWKVGLDRLKELYEVEVHRESLSGSWAGDRLICMGDYAKDIPKGMMTEEEFADLGDSSHLWYALSEYCSRPFRTRAKWAAIARANSFEEKLTPAFIQWALPENTKLEYWCDPEDPWVLRNLSKKVYVRADTLALNPETVTGPWVAGMSFGSIVASHICWSSDPSMSMSVSPHYRGIWAGDRFDVVQLSQVATDWTDVTMAAKQELSSIWESEYGEDWERVVVEENL